MATVVCKFDGSELSEFEYEEFLVEDDPEPPGRWNCSYLVKVGEEDGPLAFGSHYWYHVDLPSTKSGRNTYIRKHEVLNRDLTCTAIGMSCHLSSYTRIETEPRKESLTMLAIKLENSRAMILGREPRKLISLLLDGTPLV